MGWSRQIEPDEPGCPAAGSMRCARSWAALIRGSCVPGRDGACCRPTFARPLRTWRGRRRLMPMPPVARPMAQAANSRECRSSGTPPGGMDRSPMLPVGGMPGRWARYRLPDRPDGRPRSGRTGSNLVVSISDYYLRRVVERLGQTVRVNESTALIAQLLSRASRPETQAVPSVSADMDGGTSTAPDSIEATQPRTIARL